MVKGDSCVLHVTQELEGVMGVTTEWNTTERCSPQCCCVCQLFVLAKHVLYHLAGIPACPVWMIIWKAKFKTEKGKGEPTNEKPRQNFILFQQNTLGRVYLRFPLLARVISSPLSSSFLISLWLRACYWVNVTFLCEISIDLWSNRSQMPGCLTRGAFVGKLRGELLWRMFCLLHFRYYS